MHHVPRRPGLALFALVLPLLAAIALPSGAPARADVRAPGDELCTAELQARDGARCEACTVIVTDPSTAGACDALAARGWTVRCARGATVHTTVYCDRPAGAAATGGGGGTASGGGVTGGATAGGGTASGAGGATAGGASDPAAGSSADGGGLGCAIARRERSGAAGALGLALAALVIVGRRRVRGDRR